MRKTKLFALTLAGMMVFGSATPVLAETTDVGFTKTGPNKAYTMTVPTGNTSVATDGTFSSIGELKVVSDDTFDTGSKVEVTVSRSTVMTNTESSITSNNTITYDLYTGTSKVNDNKVANGAKIAFSASQIDAQTPVQMGVAISGSNYDALEPGDYRDTITFTASAVAAATTVNISGVEINAVNGQTWETIIANNSGKLKEMGGRVGKIDDESGSGISMLFLKCEGMHVHTDDTFDSSKTYTLEDH